LKAHYSLKFILIPILLYLSACSVAQDFTTDLYDRTFEPDKFEDRRTAEAAEIQAKKDAQREADRQELKEYHKKQMETYNKQCHEYGFQKGTIKFSECLMHQEAEYEKRIAISSTKPDPVHQPTNTHCYQFGNSMNCTSY